MLDLDSERISPSQLSLLLVGLILSSTAMLPPGLEAKQDAWIAVLLGAGETALLVLGYAALAGRFPGRSLIEINDASWGPIIGRLASASLVWYAFHLLTLEVSTFSDFIDLAILPETPPYSYVLLGVGICSVAASAGIEVLGRCMQIVVPCIVALCAATTALLLPVFRPDELQPVLSTPLPQLLRIAHTGGTLPFASSVLFLSVFPSISKRQKVSAAAVAGVALAGLVLALAAVRTTATLGSATSLYLYPSFAATSLVDLGDLGTRLDILAAVNILLMGFAELSVLIYITCLSGAQLLGLRSYRTLVVPVWLLVSLVAMHNFDSVLATLDFASRAYPLYVMPFQIGLPLLTLMVATVRRVPREGS